MKAGKHVITFGKHRGTAVEDLPASYLLWFYDQSDCPKPIVEYVDMHRKTLEQEHKDERKGYFRTEGFINKLRR
jgi:uncharacterized protein (DUF3820 family)